MLRREFLSSLAATFVSATQEPSSGEKIAIAARSQVGVTLSYDPSYLPIPYPGGDVPRTTGTCTDVVIRACRDGLGLDLQKLVHEDIERAYSDYPLQQSHSDTNIDHRRVLNLEAFWRRAGACRWTASGPTAGDAFPEPLLPGDFITWLIDGHLHHVGIVIVQTSAVTRLIHNMGGGAQETELETFHARAAKGHYRWPTA
jgi:uncharacterized protein